jgi:hypothetical protein
MRWIPIMVATGCLAAAGCGGVGPGAGAPAGQNAPKAGTAKNASAECPVGRYRVTKMTPGPAVDTGDYDVRLSGGTSMTIEFTAAGKWTLSDDGGRPLRATVSAPGVGSVSGTATVRGELTGAYARSGSDFAFTRNGGSGSVALRSPAGNDRKSITAVGEALAPSGTATITCSGDKATVKSENVTMTLKRTDGGGEGGTDGGDTSGGGGSGASAGGGESAGALVLRGTSRVHNVNCAGRDIVVTGRSMTVNLGGKCPKIRVTGDQNTVNIDQTDSVVITGTSNVVNVAGGRAKVDDRGSSNVINQ